MYVDFYAEQNSLGHQKAKKYYEKVFGWTPSKSFRDTIQFVLVYSTFYYFKRFIVT